MDMYKISLSLSGNTEQIEEFSNLMYKPILLDRVHYNSDKFKYYAKWHPANLIAFEDYLFTSVAVVMTAASIFGLFIPMPIEYMFPPFVDKRNIGDIHRFMLRTVLYSPHGKRLGFRTIEDVIEYISAERIVSRFHEKLVWMKNNWGSFSDAINLKWLDDKNLEFYCVGDIPWRVLNAIINKYDKIDINVQTNKLKEV